MSAQQREQTEYSFVQKVWIVGLIFSLIAIILLIFEATFNILILVLAGSLIACFFRGLSSYIKDKAGWNEKITLSISVIGPLLIIAGTFWLIGATISSQASQIEKTLPSLIEEAQNSLSGSRVGREITVQLEQLQSTKKIPEYLSKFFMTTFGGIGDVYIILLIGIFFTISPQLYKNGIIQMVPPRKREKAQEVLTHLGSDLTKWLAGKFIAMFAVFCLTSIGLVIMGIPMWLILAIMAGVLNFIPNFGPLAAMIPAVLVAIAISPTTALIIVIMYTVIQLIESSFITPKAQQKLVNIPPALIIISQIFVGAMTGIWGLIFATPLVLILIILVQDLYVKPMEEKKQHSD
ncbi:AI-2E family transporter [Salegentibacter sp. JZCK2]|uniref:AI-2E family transporter n=1 Tax=Salegentibacter tibetensis TaxID=2873600 RepID=UPI001CCEA717|nr:AI-2E family transporter [Salegentibacter tibetensis]MBZ9728106.1 AI-2E family transporter [Salegentibacter tibetensis]